MRLTLVQHQERQITIKHTLNRYDSVAFKCFYFIMAALRTVRSRCGRYIFILWFLLSSFYLFPRLISAVADWMPTILSHMV